MKIRSFFCTLAFVSFAAFISVSCSKDKPEDNLQDILKAAPYRFLDTIMSNAYYWADETKTPNIKECGSIEEYFNAYLVPKDRWSYMCDGPSYVLLSKGIYKGYGFEAKQSLEFYRDYTLYVSIVHQASPAGKAGVKRGWVWVGINGVDIMTLISNGTLQTESSRESNTFNFIDSNGMEREITMSKATFQSSTVADSRIFTSDNCPELKHPVGYINYLTFEPTREQEIKDAIAQMKSANVKELILDLRYNGGGYNAVLNRIANLLATPGCNGKLFNRQVFNNNYKYLESEPMCNVKIERTDESLDLDRLYIISSDNTASASEVLINGLKPLMDVKVVGDTTYGKPNGMFVFQYPEKASVPDYVFMPICFYNVNSLGKADFDNGMVPDNYRPDYPCRDWCDDEIVRACITDIATGSFPPLNKNFNNKTKSGFMPSAGESSRYVLPRTKKDCYLIGNIN